MKGGFVTEVHVVIYCDCCGDIYTENIGESICFDSTNQAVSYINSRAAAGFGWIYDGDSVLCDGCLATAHCEEHGHTFPRRRVPARLLKNTPPDRTCTVCGVAESETQS